MTAPGFTAHGKQVLANGAHYADAADTKAAQFIAEACEAKAKGWQPIETAPRDGTYILAIVAPNDTRHLGPQAGRMFVIRHEGVTRRGGYDMGWAVYPGYGGASDHNFTHWMPLPSAPEQAK